MRQSIEAILDRQYRRWQHELRSTGALPASPAPEWSAPPHPIVTVARQHGTRGAEVASRVARRLGYTFVDHDAAERISAFTGVTRRRLAVLDEHARSPVTQWLESMLDGRFVDESDFATGLVAAVRALARAGGVVVVGRGMNFLLGPGGGTHVRVVAPRESRIRAIMERRDAGRAEAAREIDSVEHERDTFIHRVTRRWPDDPFAYDLVLNEAAWQRDEMVEMVVRAADLRRRPARERPLPAA